MGGKEMDHDHSTGRRRRLRAVASIAVVAVALTFAAPPVIGDGLNQKPTPAFPTIVGTVVATDSQSSAAGDALGSATSSAAKKNKKKRKAPARRPAVLESRVTEVPVVTEEGKGTFLGVKCPSGSKAISGGVVSSYINLLISSSAPNHPLTGKYTPRTWWLTVTNSNIDGQGGSLSWRGVVNCLAPISLKR